MNRIILALLGCSLTSRAWASPNHVEVVEDEQGFRLQVDGVDTYVYGMNWGYLPIGENYSYDFWGQDEAFVTETLKREMALLKRMGVNSIRQFPGIPPQWVTWIYDNYGITTMMNPHFGRYGLTIDGRWVPITDYSDTRTREVILEETLAVVEQYKDVRGILLFLLGNENNYGLSWSSFEIEALPKGEQNTARARHLYSLWGEAVDAIHAVDGDHPVAICNGDLQYAELIAELVPNLDILGSNVYRGASSTDIFQRTRDELGVPFLYTEFGSDAYNARDAKEDHLAQASYLRDQWRELYEQSWGKGSSGTAIGGYVFQWSDGWWKYLQVENLDVHDNTASWPNNAYAFDFVEGQNNMNEEWFGITAKGPPDPQGRYDVYPRSAYYLLQDAFELDVYAPSTTRDSIADHFGRLEPSSYAAPYAADQAAMAVKRLSKVRLDDVRLDFSTTASSSNVAAGGLTIPTLDHTESVFIDTSVHPSADFRASASVNLLGNVASNRIDNIFYENRGSDLSIEDAAGATVDLSGLERVRLYGADFQWQNDRFDLKGFYRRGHYHWAYEGDIFGIYREAFYGNALDIYNGNAPIGVELTGKGKLGWLEAAFGPELFWGANPAATVKARRAVGKVTITAMHWEEFARASTNQISRAIPEPQSRKTTLALETERGPFGLTLGGITAGSNRIGWEFQELVPASGDTSYLDSGSDVLIDEITALDTLGGRAKLTMQAGPVSAYVQGAVKGLVADGGGDPTITFTGWTLKESGRGNQLSGLGGASVRLGKFEVAPNVLWQKPLVGPVTSVDGSYSAETGWFYGSLRPRNIFDDPFVVRDNRETTAFELLLSFDPTPETWMWAWDNVTREDAAYATSLNFVYRMQPTSTDAGIGFTEDGVVFVFGKAPPAQDVWDLKWRGISAIRGDTRITHTLYGGTAQSSGEDDRLITRYGGDLSLWWRTAAFTGSVKVNDWGPYDYHRNFNLTFPVQLIGDASVGLEHPRYDGSGTRLGVSGKLRYLDENSERYVPGAGGYGVWGQELEIGAYIKVGM